MKQFRYIFIVMLSVLGCMPMKAQVAVEDGEAFYVYRNDGDFNGFFYDDVIEMRQSRFDQDSVEYDSYVMQEIVTADSIYRIPLCAIDSISFVQPEIILNDKLFIMDAEGTATYVIRAEGRSVLLDNKIPSQLLPKVGNVVVGVNDEIFGEDFRAFKVKKVETTSDGILLSGDKITSLSDVFVQFVSVESVGTGNAGNARHRVAGLNTIRKAQGSFGANIINFNGTLQREFDLGANSTITLMLNLGLGFGLDVAYRINTSDLFVKVNMKESVSAQVGAKLAVSGSGSKPIKFLGDIGSIKFPGFLPVFQVDPIPNAVFRYGGELSASVTMPGFSYESSQTIIFNSNDRPMLSGTWYSNEGKPDEMSMKNMLSSPDFSLSLNGFIQLAIQLDGKLKTNSWISDIFSSAVGVEMNVGPKLSGNINFSYGQYAKDGMYGALKDSKITFTPCSIDTEAKAELSFLGEDPEAKTFYSTSTSFGDFDLYLLPEVSDEIEVDEYAGTIDVTAKLSRLTILPVEMNYFLFTKDSFDPKDPDACLTAALANWKESNAGFLGDTLSFHLDKFYPGKYILVPVISSMITGNVYLMSMARELVFNPRKPNIKAARIKIPIIEEKCELSVTNNDYLVTCEYLIDEPINKKSYYMQKYDTIRVTENGHNYLKVKVELDFSDPDTFRIANINVVRRYSVKRTEQYWHWINLRDCRLEDELVTDLVDNDSYNVSDVKYFIEKQWFDVSFLYDMHSRNLYIPLPSENFTDVDGYNSYSGTRRHYDEWYDEMRVTEKYGYDDEWKEVGDGLHLDLEFEF